MKLLRHSTTATGALWPLITATFLGTAACGAAPEDEADLELGETSEEIINGTPFNPNGTYYVMIHHGGPGTIGSRPYNTCSGTLIRNDVVLTARHCVTSDRSIGGPIDTDLDNFDLYIGSQHSGAYEIIDAFAPHDVALIVADEFFEMHGRNTGWDVPIYDQPSSTLIGRELFCAGYGTNTVPANAANADILRFAWLTPSSVTTNHLVYPMNSSGQNIFHGDSGGSCIFTGTFGDALMATGVNTTCSTNASVCNQVRPERFRATAEAELFARGDSIVHEVTSANRSFNWTVIDHPDANNNPNAIVTVASSFNPPSAPGGYNNHHLGVWYTGTRWAIFNQGGASIPVGRTFNVSVSSGPDTFVHQASSGNTSGHITTINHPELNGDPSAGFIITQNWNPAGVGGTYNNRAVGAWYSGGRWKIFNQDLAAMPIGAAFNIRIDRSYAVSSTNVVRSGNVAYLDDPNLNGHPEARLFVTPNFSAGASYVSAPLGVWYASGVGKWAVFTQDLSSMPATGFNVLMRP